VNSVKRNVHDAELIERILHWRSEEIRGFLDERHELELDVVALTKWLSGPPLGGRLGLDVKELHAVLDQGFEREDLVQAMIAVLEKDPSIEGKPLASAGGLFEETPFPRHVVALIYLMLIHCSRYDFSGLGEAVWVNLLNARHPFGERVLLRVLGRFFSDEELTERALDVVAAGDERIEYLALQILYGLHGGRHAREELRECLLKRIDQEESLSRTQYYRTLYKKLGPIHGFLHGFGLVDSPFAPQKRPS